MASGVPPIGAQSHSSSFLVMLSREDNVPLGLGFLEVKANPWRIPACSTLLVYIRIDSYVEWFHFLTCCYGMLDSRSSYVVAVCLPSHSYLVASVVDGMSQCGHD